MNGEVAQRVHHSLALHAEEKPTINTSINVIKHRWTLAIGSNDTGKLDRRVHLLSWAPSSQFQEFGNIQWFSNTLLCQILCSILGWKAPLSFFKSAIWLVQNGGKSHCSPFQDESLLTPKRPLAAQQRHQIKQVLYHFGTAAYGGADGDRNGLLVNKFLRRFCENSDS